MCLKEDDSFRLSSSPTAFTMSPYIIDAITCWFAPSSTPQLKILTEIDVQTVVAECSSHYSVHKHGQGWGKYSNNPDSFN